MVLFDILRYSLSSMVWGVLIAVICLGLFIFLIKGWYKDATFSPISYVVGVILFLFLTFQCILIVGSMKIIDMSDEYENRITTIVNSVYSSSDEISLSQASDVIDRIIDEYPILNYYISGGEFSGFTARELPHAMAQELRSFMRWYIFRRILWCLAFVIIGAICVIKSLSNNHSRQRPQRTQRERVQCDRKRVSRRPRR